MADDKGKKDEGGAGVGLEEGQKATLEIIDGQIKLSKEQLDLVSKMEEMTDAQLHNYKQILSANVQNNVVQGEMLASMGQIAQAAEAYEAARKRHNEAALAAKQSIKEMDELVLKIAEETDDKKKKALEERYALLKEMKDFFEGEIATNEQRLNLLEEETSEYRNLTDAGKKAYNDMKPGIQKVATGVFQIVQAQDTMIGGAMMHIAALQKQHGAVNGLKLAFKEVFNLTNIMASATQVVLDSFITMVMALDKAQAKFAAATGTGRQYMKSIESVRKTNMHLGVGLENTTQAFEGLLTEMIGFTDISTENQNVLAGQVAQLDRLGIKSDQVADMMNTFGKTMGSSAQEALDLTKKLAMMGTSIGITSQRMIKDFQDANKTLAVFGKRGPAIFTNLAAAAKAAGVEMNDLLGITKGFDTFEESADKVAKLNAILGSNLSATQLNRMEDDERIETIIRQIQVSGQSFAQMDKFKQMAIANAAGITDMAKANRLFGMSMSQYRSYSNEMKNAALEQEKLDAATKATQTIQEQFQNMMLEFAPQVSDFLETFKSGMEFLQGAFAGINKVLNPLGMSMGGIIITLGTLGLALKLLSPIMTAVSFASGGIAKGNAMVGKTGPSAAKGFRLMATGLRAMGKAGATAVTTILSVGAAVLMIGGGIAIAALGVAELVSAFAGLGPAAGYAALAVGLLIIPFVAFFAVMALVVYSGVGPLAAGVMLAMGAAALMLGIGIGIAAFGMSYLVDAIVGLGANGLVAAVSFMMIAQGMALMMLSAALLGVALYYMIPALIGAGVTSVGAALGIGILGLSMAFAGGGAALLSLGLSLVADSIMKLADNGASAGTGLGAVGLGLLGMAAGLAAMFVFISNPLGWLVIGAAMMLMAAGVRAFTAGLGELSEDKLKHLQGVAQEFNKLAGLSAEASIIGTVTTELEDFKDTMDATMMAQIASLGVFSDVKSINTIKAESQVQNQINLPDKIVVDAKNTIHTKIGDKEFVTHVKNAINEAKWGSFDGGAENLVAAGNSRLT